MGVVAGAGRCTMRYAPSVWPVQWSSLQLTGSHYGYADLHSAGGV